MTEISTNWNIFFQLFVNEKGKLTLPNLSTDSEYYLDLLKIAILHPIFIQNIGIKKIKKYIKSNNLDIIVKFNKKPNDDLAPLVYKGGDITILSPNGY